MTATSQASFSVKRPPKKPTNAERRSREYLTTHEVDHVIAAARKAGRHSCRDVALILLMGFLQNTCICHAWHIHVYLNHQIMPSYRLFPLHLFDK